MDNQKTNDIFLVVAFNYQQKESLEKRIDYVIDVALSQEYTKQVVIKPEMVFVMFPKKIIKENSRNWQSLLFSLCEAAMTDKCYIVTKTNNRLDVCAYKKEELSKDNWPSISEPFEEFIQTLEEQSCENINIDEVSLHFNV